MSNTCLTFTKCLLICDPNYWSRILSERTKSLIRRLDVRSLDNYDEMKRFLLGEFKLTAIEYKTRFYRASKRFDETHVLFASRLHNESGYYLSSRGVDNFETLCNLLVSDKLKSCLAPGTLNYVLSLEVEGCFQPNQVARLAVTYINCHIGRLVIVASSVLRREASISPTLEVIPGV